jgi:hypothetical protein
MPWLPAGYPAGIAKGVELHSNEFWHRKSVIKRVPEQPGTADFVRQTPQGAVDEAPKG